MTMNIDFSSLTLQDALDLAILIEDEAEERYNEFTAQMETHHTPEAAEFFRFMAGNERRHGQELRQRRVALFGRAERRVDSSALFDVEAPQYDKARAFMSAKDALQVALQSEVKAFDYFDAALAHVADQEVRELFAELREEEVDHQRLVKRELAKLPPEPGFDPTDFVDEPVGL